MDIGNVRCPSCGRHMVPVSCTCRDCRLKLEGDFSVSILSLLPQVYQALMIAFVRSFGSIKKIQEILGVSYPTARMRIAGIIERLDGLMEAPETNENEVLDLLQRGDISFDEAIERL